MSKANSPLRYPGGKAVLSNFLSAAINANKIENCIYAEPYAGGAGAAVNLLFEGKVDRIILNDADPNIWAFWCAILRHTDTFLKMIETTPVTVEEWRHQKAIYESKRGSIIRKGFAAFFLNRCNRSGILMNGGVIGGIKQDGKWKIDARFNRIELQKRIERIAAFEDNIIVTNLDALRFIKTVVSKSPDKDRMFVYLDPPYYVKGSELYLNFYQHKDHIALSKSLQRVRDTRWVVTYDNTPQISSLYEWADVQPFSLRYSAHTAREGSELLISPKYVNVPVEVLHESVAAS